MNRRSVQRPTRHNRVGLFQYITPETVAASSFVKNGGALVIPDLKKAALAEQLAVAWWKEGSGKTSGLPTASEIDPYVKSVIACAKQGGFPLPAGYTYDGHGGSVVLNKSAPAQQAPAQQAPGQNAAQIPPQPGLTAQQCALLGGAFDPATSLCSLSEQQTHDLCTKLGGSWDGANCSFPGGPPSQADACKALGGVWDGAACNIPDPATDCAKQGGTWDGKVCSKKAPPIGYGGIILGSVIAAVSIGILVMTLNQKKGSSR